MLDVCIYFNEIPFDNQVCNNCKDFLETCHPIINSVDGFSASSECDRYLCEGCCHIECLYHSFINA